MDLGSQETRPLDLEAAILWGQPLDLLLGDLGHQLAIPQVVVAQGEIPCLLALTCTKGLAAA